MNEGDQNLSPKWALQNDYIEINIKRLGILIGKDFLQHSQKSTV